MHTKAKTCHIILRNNYEQHLAEKSFENDQYCIIAQTSKQFEVSEYNPILVVSNSCYI